MKLRKHNNKTYKITWSLRTRGELKEQPEILTKGSNSRSVLNAFLFGRDRTNIVAEVWLRKSGFPTISKSGNVWFGVKYYKYGSVSTTIRPV